MAEIKLLKYATATDFDSSINKEYKAPVPVGGNSLIPLLKNKTIDSVLWLGNDDQHIYLFHLLLNDHSSILVSQGAGQSVQVIYKPPQN
jgi:hypothetical protein